jgi:cytochrome c553
MRELQSPWTHFFEPPFATPPDITPPGIRGYDLLNEYVAAKGDELYGGMSVAGVAFVAPFVLQNVVGFTQPLLFDAPRIEDERWPYSADSGYATVPSPSPTWDAAYDAFKRGEQLALPYLDTRASDLDKQTQVSAAYQRYRAGEIAADELPDMADVFPDDPSVRAQIGLQTEPDATPVEALIQACGACHNDVLDQSISRARFNVAVSRLERAELERAIERIQRQPSEPGAMPPPDARQLDASAQARLLEYLRQDSRSADDDAKLEHAATLGMAGGARTIIDEHDD